MTTPVDLINLALKQVGVLGVGQTAAAEDVTDAFRMLNMLLAQWSVKRNVVHQILDVAFPADGRSTYTIGLGGDINIDRPARLIGAYVRQSTTIPVDSPLQLLQSQTEWGRISTKTIGSMPSLVYYDPQYPVGVLHVWPIAPNGYELHIQALMPLSRFETPFDDINLPPEYEEALMYNLAGRLYPMYGMQADQVVIKLASASLATLRTANTQIGKLHMPESLVRGSSYNVYSDR